ncbi:hypothetical protein [Comamonas testosteroni]|uniref:hypothetical protein n=1 Tax=Comamonas testosteroni TaxID=285 RepID=UPI003B3BA2F6
MDTCVSGERLAEALRHLRARGFKPTCNRHRIRSFEGARQCKGDPSESGLISGTGISWSTQQSPFSIDQLTFHPKFHTWMKRDRCATSHMARVCWVNTIQLQSSRTNFLIARSTLASITCAMCMTFLALTWPLTPLAKSWSVKWSTPGACDLASTHLSFM